MKKENGSYDNEEQQKAWEKTHKTNFVGLACLVVVAFFNGQWYVGW